MNDKIENIVYGLVRGYRKLQRKRVVTKKVERILVIRLDHLGDMVCTSPFIRELRKNYPQAKIDLLCSDEVYNYIELNPYVDNIIKYKHPDIKGHIFEKTLMFMYKFAKQNFAHKYYDIIFTPEYPTPPVIRILAHFIHGNNVVSFVSLDNKIVLTDTNFYQAKLPARHTVENCLDLLIAVDCQWSSDELEIWSDDNDRRVVTNLFVSEGIQDDKLKLVLFLSTSAPYKDWAVENYAQVVKLLQEKCDVQIILLGAQRDTEIKGKQFMQLVPEAHNLIGKTTIRQTGVVISKSDLYLGGDTGTLHLAAACKIPGVVITKDYDGAIGGDFGTLMDRFYPWKAPIRIKRPKKPIEGCETECRKSYAHCINQIKPGEVFNELLDIIKK